MSRMLDIGVAFFSGSLIFALPRPCADVGAVPSIPSYSFHSGAEPKVPAYYGKGADRQILIFCVHVVPDVGFAQIVTHIVHVFDDPERPEKPVEGGAVPTSTPELKLEAP